jgi:hypothetical protein
MLGGSHMESYMKRAVEVIVDFEGSGKVVHLRNGAFSGGVRSPRLGKHVGFSVHREISDEDGVLSPIPGEPAVDGAFQINIAADSEGFRRLGTYLLGLAELDASADKGYHEHHEDLLSEDGRTRLHVIGRKRRGRAT